MDPKVFAVAAAALCAHAALAAGTITDGTASYSNGFGTPFATNTGNADLLGVAPTDPLFHAGWGYRQTSNLTGNAVMGNFGVSSQSYSGDTSVISYLNNGFGPAGAARFDAVITTRLEQTASGARIYSTVAITNINATSMVLDLFQVIDWDIDGLSGDTASLVSDTGGITLRQVDNGTGNVASLYSSSATRYDAASGFALRSGYSGGIGNLTNSDTFTGDAALGLQWTLTIGAGQTATITSIYAYGEVVPAPAAAALLGLGGLAAARRRRA